MAGSSIFRFQLEDRKRCTFFYSNDVRPCSRGATIRVGLPLKLWHGSERTGSVGAA